MFVDSTSLGGKSNEAGLTRATPSRGRKTPFTLSLLKKQCFFFHLTEGTGLERSGELVSDVRLI